MRNVSKSQKFFEQIFKYASRIEMFVLSILMVIGVLLLTMHLFFKANIINTNFSTICWLYLRPIVLILFAILAISMVFFIIGSIYSSRTDDDLRDSVTSPLENVSKKQEKEIIKALKTAIRPLDNSNKLNRAHTVKFLLALRETGHLNTFTNVNELRLWVEQVTGFRDSDRDHFTEAYEREKKKNGERPYVKELENLLAKVK